MLEVAAWHAMKAGAISSSLAVSCSTFMQMVHQDGQRYVQQVYTCTSTMFFSNRFLVQWQSLKTCLKTWIPTLK